MSHVEITLKSGVTITADVGEWSRTTRPISGFLDGFEWTHDGPRRLNYIRVEEVAAVVFVAEQETP